MHEHNVNRPADYRRLVEAAETIGLIFFAVRVRPDIRLEYLSEAVEGQLGIAAAAATAEPRVLHALLDESDQSELVAALAAEPGQQSSVILTWRPRDSRTVVTRCSMRARVRPDGSVVVEGTATDITDVQGRLALADERLRLLAENSSDVVWTQSADGTQLTYYCDGVERTRGFTREQALRQTIAEMHTPASAIRLTEYIERVAEAVAAGRVPPEFRGELEYNRADGSVMDGDLRVIPHVDADGRFVEYLGILRDVSERRRYEAELARLAATDELTGVFNRRRGAELLAAAYHRHRTHGQPLSLLMIDVDNFKAVNDIAGHQTGDQVLARTAECIADIVGNDGVVARWGGDEFVILRACALAEASRLAELIRGCIRQEHFDPIGHVTVSIGVAELAPEEDLHAWLTRTDHALYEAKRSGRDMVRLNRPAAARTVPPDRYSG